MPRFSLSKRIPIPIIIGWELIKKDPISRAYARDRPLQVCPVKRQITVKRQFHGFSVRMPIFILVSARYDHGIGIDGSEELFTVASVIGTSVMCGLIYICRYIDPACQDGICFLPCCVSRKQE